MLMKAVSYGRKQGDKRRVRKLELREKIICRCEGKRQKRNEKARKALEKRLQDKGLEDVLLDFTSVSTKDELTAEDLLLGNDRQKACA